MELCQQNKLRNTEVSVVLMDCLLCVIYRIPPLQMKQPSNIFWLALTAINAKCTHCTCCARRTRRKCRTRRTRHPTPDVRQLIAMLVDGSHWLPIYWFGRHWLWRIRRIPTFYPVSSTKPTTKKSHHFSTMKQWVCTSNYFYFTV